MVKLQWLAVTMTRGRLHPLIEMTCAGSSEGIYFVVVSPSPTQLAMSWD
jgi:hypothetical protein